MGDDERMATVERQSDGKDDDDGATGNTSTNIRALRDLIDEKKRESVLSLGRDLFNQVYSLCSKHMLEEFTAAEGDGDGRNGLAHGFDDLQDTLISQFKDVEGACA